jgi:circadian clock protein KaiC
LEQLARIESGITGLDTLLNGGLVAGSSYIVQGRPGSGKTIFANQIAFHHAARGGRVLVATLLSETHERLFQFLSTLSFFDRERIGSEMQFVSAFDTLQGEGLDEVVKLLRREISRQKASVLIVDGVLNARSRAETAIDTKKFIAELQGHAAFAGCTVLFLTSARLDDGSPEHTMVDGVIELGEDLSGARSVRRLNLRKTRGSGALSGLHEYEITQDGIVVYPRLEALLSRPSVPENLDAGVLSTGVADLNELIGGGFQQASATMLIGPSGSGKTSLGLAFLSQSTLEEPGLHFGFYESEERLKRKASALGFDLRSRVEAGAVQILCQSTTEHLLDALGHRLLNAVRQGNIRRVFIDSLGGMSRAAVRSQRIVEFFTALINELRARGVTVIATWEIRDMFDFNAQAPALELSSIFDNMVLLRFIESHAQLRRILTVIKVRDSQYDPSLREMMLSPDGIQLRGVFQEPVTDPSDATIIRSGD